MLIDKSSELFRHQTEVRQILAWRTEDRGKAMEYLARVKGDRRDRLEKDCRDQWERGNRGKWGDWRGL